jgi:hypothetical protein
MRTYAYLIAAVPVVPDRTYSVACEDRAERDKGGAA